MPFPAEKCTVLQKMRFSVGTILAAGNCRRVSGLKNQGHQPAFTSNGGSETEAHTLNFQRKWSENWAQILPGKVFWSLFWALPETISLHLTAGSEEQKLLRKEPFQPDWRLLGQAPVC